MGTALFWDSIVLFYLKDGAPFLSYKKPSKNKSLIIILFLNNCLLRICLKKQSKWTTLQFSGIMCFHVLLILTVVFPLARITLGFPIKFHGLKPALVS